MGVREGEGAGRVGVGRDEAFAELGEDDFERLPKPSRTRTTLLAGMTPSMPSVLVSGGALHAFGEGEVGLGVVGVNEEGGAARSSGVLEEYVCQRRRRPRI